MRSLAERVLAERDRVDVLVNYNGTREARADPQAYYTEARQRLREVSEELVGLSG